MFETNRLIVHVTIHEERDFSEKEDLSQLYEL